MMSLYYHLTVFKCVAKQVNITVLYTHLKHIAIVPDTSMVQMKFQNTSILMSTANKAGTAAN